MPAKLLYRYLLLIFVMTPCDLEAQFTDDFSDGDFTQNPAWNGDHGDFIINSSYQLQLNASIAGESFLSTPSSVINDTEWQFWVKQSFVSSVNNHSRVYLVSDQTDLKGPLNGYYVQIGATIKNLTLWKQSGTNTNMLIDGTHASTASSVNEIRVKVTRDNLGNWRMQSDPNGGVVFADEGNAFDNSFTSTNSFGILCKYTISNSTRFFYDDIYVGPIIIDSIPPSIESVRVVSSIQLEVLFSEAVEQSSAENNTNYIVNQGIGNPVSALRDVQNPALLHLTFASPFPEAVYCTLSVNNVEDLEGNTATNLQIPFAYYLPKAYDVVINEIMAKPGPVVGLPNEEYVELLNRTPFDIDLSGWKYFYGNNERIIDNKQIKANSYLLLSRNAAETELSTYGDFYGFSSFVLTDAGQRLVLKNNNNQIIHTVNYSENWYGSNYKKGGGWSLEMIDTDNPCSGSLNWTASVDPRGGTPGKVNSVAASKPDLFPPELWYVTMIDEFTIGVYFNESIDSTDLINLNAFVVTPDNRKPFMAKPISPSYNAVNLSYTQRFEEGIIYTLSVSDRIADCAGNVMPLGESKRFGVPLRPDSADMVINEILFNPKVNGVDFVELYNRSDKILNLGDLLICSWDYDTDEPKDIKTISETGFLLFPSEYIVLSTNGQRVRSHYFTTNSGGFVDLPSMPSFNNSNGTAVIITREGIILDFFYYEDNMHFPLLRDVKGVSLERISFNRPASDRDNWHSASETAGFATPAYANSQMMLGKLPKGKLSTEPEIFSPDNDGRDDVLLIHYEMDKAGYTGTLTIFDSKGRRVRLLKNNEYLGISGTYTWNGLDDSDRKLPIGIYLISFEVFDLQGNRNTFKTTTVLGGRL